MDLIKIQVEKIIHFMMKNGNDRCHSCIRVRSFIKQFLELFKDPAVSSFFTG